jgi:DNA-binding SARP family transcriptional activator
VSGSAAEVRVQLCGRFAFVVAGREVHPVLPGRRARLVLAYLTTHRDRTTDRTRLLDALWPDAERDSAAASLSAILSKVRSSIAPAEISGRGTLQLRLPPGAIVDAERAVAALHEAESALAQQQWHRAWGPARTALLIGGRSFLAGHDEPWIEPWRAQFDLLFQRALECYAQACLRIGGTELPAAERSARRLVERAPLSEIGYRLLMEVLAERGDTTAALATYEQLRRTVRDELGADPGPEIRRLHQKLSGRHVPALPPAARRDRAQVRLLGPVDVLVDGAASPVPGARRKAVLAALGLRPGEIVSTARLVELVWAGSPPATAEATLQNHVSYLRGVLGGRPTIVARPPGYVLDLGPDATDVEAAERLVHQAQRATDPHERISALRAAVQLWRGRPLADVTGHPWLDQQAERLADLRLVAMHALLAARLDRGEHEQVLPELSRLADEHPYDEQFCRQLMVALYRSSRQADALARYQAFRRRLVDDLGIDPGPALRDLEARILQQDRSLVPAQPR